MNSTVLVMKFFSSAPSPATDRSIRRYPRSIFTAPLTLRHLSSGGVRKLRGITLDVSAGGMGALVQGDLRLGEPSKSICNWMSRYSMRWPSFATPALSVAVSNFWE